MTVAVPLVPVITRAMSCLAKVIFRKSENSKISGNAGPTRFLCFLHGDFMCLPSHQFRFHGPNMANVALFVSFCLSGLVDVTINVANIGELNVYRGYSIT